MLDLYVIVSALTHAGGHRTELDMDPHLHLEISEETPKADAEFVAESLRAFNRQHGTADVRPLNILVRDGEGRIVGGLLGYTWHTMCHVQILWIDEAHRRAGLGSKLLASVEDEAKKRGCTVSHLDTYSFQAPGFYAKHGYIPEYTCTAYPRGIFKRYYTKPLTH